jgi:PIN domain nuclease of toxin-antitoxin system
VLVDAHTLIWAVDDPGRLGPVAVLTLSDPANDLLVSAGTAWEIAVKVGVGKLNLSLPYRDWISQALATLRANLLPITIDHAAAQVGLPFHHRDPFDRLLIAQAMVEGMPVVSADPTFDLYPVTSVG